jgi:hypothetical protein
MWEEDVSGFEPDGQQPPEYGAPEEPEVPPPAAQFPQFPQAVPLPNMVPVMDLYAAARARAVADQQLSKLFNPEYYI